MIAKLKLYAAMAGAFVVALVAVWLKGRSEGSSIERAKAAAKQIKDAKTVQQKRTQSERMSKDEANKEFGRWTPRK
ncbi:hypothetical protein [Maritalea porphyrae]|uniref:hypothetical protein n=1 Tax=Maritalea porphyrae TaxID=880732 RepID=UPI0022AF3A45|nr:hypothetical protein [Maritalea porphyrae]MCZ4273225.1 hypothetical protein [Maritalea porphyrae]